MEPLPDGVTVELVPPDYTLMRQPVTDQVQEALNRCERDRIGIPYEAIMAEAERQVLIDLVAEGRVSQDEAVTRALYHQLSMIQTVEKQEHDKRRKRLMGKTTRNLARIG